MNPWSIYFHATVSPVSILPVSFNMDIFVGFGKIKVNDYLREGHLIKGKALNDAGHVSSVS